MSLLDKLTPREQETARLVTLGYSNKQIAVELNTTEQVIKNRMRAIFDKVGADTRLQLALLLVRESMGA